MFREDTNNLYNNVYLSFSLDFYSPLKRNKLASIILNNTKIKTIFSDVYVKNNLTSKNIRICRNDYGGSKMNQIQTGFLPYYQCVNLLFKLLDIIDVYGYTNSKCKAVTSIKLNSDKLNVPKISQINTLKLINSIDECNLSDKWYKNKHDKIYLNSLLYIYPTNMKLADDNSVNNFINFKNFKYPSSNKFNLYFDNLKRDIVTVKYVKYKDYQKNKRSFNYHINDIINSVYRVLKSNDIYSQNELSKIKKVMKTQRDIMNSIWTYDKLCKNHEKIKVFVDLKDDPQVISTFYPNIRQKLFELMSYCSFNSGDINYDSEKQSMQVRDANIYNGHYVSGIEFYYSRINGVLENCKFHECEVNNSKITDSELFYGNDIKNSNIFNTRFHGVENNILNSFVKNSPTLLVEANVTKSIIMGVLNFSSYIDDESEILDK